MITGIFAALMKDVFKPQNTSLLPSWNADATIGDIENVFESDICDFVDKSVSAIQNIETKISESMQSAENAKERAEHAWGIKVGFFNKGEIIDRLQDATRDMGKALLDSAEAQQLLFKHQCILVNVCKKLFEIGVRNIDTIEKTITAIELKLKGASEEELSELARTELLDVVRRLKAQEDIFCKQKKMNEKIKSLSVVVGELAEGQKIYSNQQAEWETSFAQFKNGVNEKMKPYVEGFESAIIQESKNKKKNSKIAVASMLCSFIAIVLSVVL